MHNLRTGSHRPLFLFLASLMISGAAFSASPQYQVIYRFQGGQDGYYPSASMIADSQGNLYGTTQYGGIAGNCENAGVVGCGIVFELTPPAKTGGSWTETVLYRFQGGSDGAFPQYTLIFDQAGNLYGTTANGGSANCGAGCGTVFKLSRPASPGGAWTESLLYTFLGVPSGKGDGDAATPNGLAFDSTGNLYGMAYSGGHCRTDETGTYCYGAVYKLTPPSAPGAAWSETVLYRFIGPTGAPAGPSLDAAGNLYGRAGWGKYGLGMIFALTPSSSPDVNPSLTPVYSFRGSTDARFPEPGLTFDQAGRLYGTSIGGGPNDAGAVFRLIPRANPAVAWRESVIYGFTGLADGGTPNGALVPGAGGRLYVTTQGGGAHGLGAIVELTPTHVYKSPWTDTVLHSFAGGSDGNAPVAGLTRGGKGALYGTTAAGGVNPTSLCQSNGSANACGVVFQILP